MDFPFFSDVVSKQADLQHSRPTHALSIALHYWLEITLKRRQVVQCVKQNPCTAMSTYRVPNMHQISTNFKLFLELAPKALGMESGEIADNQITASSSSSSSYLPQRSRLNGPYAWLPASYYDSWLLVDFKVNKNMIKVFYHIHWVRTIQTVYGNATIRYQTDSIFIGIFICKLVSFAKYKAVLNDVKTGRNITTYFKHLSPQFV